MPGIFLYTWGSAVNKKTSSFLKGLKILIGRAKCYTNKRYINISMIYALKKNKASAWKSESVANIFTGKRVLS